MKILHIITSPAGENSFSIKLGNAIIEKLQIENPNSTVTVRNLAENPLPHYDTIHLSSLFTPSENHTPEMAEVSKKTDELIHELFEVDALVIGVPMYNFGIPSTLKTWIDYITVSGKTFSYTENGPVGLIPEKPVFLAISTGNVYSKEELKMLDHTETYLNTILGSFLGMKKMKTLRVEGVAIPQIKETALEKALEVVAADVTWDIQNVELTA